MSTETAFETPREFCLSNKIGMTRFYEEINTGRLVARKLGRKTLIAKEAAQAWRDALPAMKIA